MRRLVTGFLGLVALGVVGIQFVPVERTNPEVDREIHWDNERTKELVYAACGDCHSNKTQWPWYSRVAPISWDLSKHVAEGRRALNFTEWPRRAETLEDIEEMVRSGAMPPLRYRLLHPRAREALDHVDELLEGLRLTYEQDPPGRRRRARSTDAAADPDPSTTDSANAAESPEAVEANEVEVTTTPPDSVAEGPPSR